MTRGPAIHATNGSLAGEPAPLLDVTFPMLVPSAANGFGGTRENRWAKARRVKAQRDGAQAQLMAATANTPSGRLPVVLNLVDAIGALRIRITRIAPRKLDDDNLAYACKAIRDGIALALGVDDGDDRLTWEYGQEKAGRIEHGWRVAPTKPSVRVQIWRRA